jgi:hypothetical protein
MTVIRQIPNSPSGEGFVHVLQWAQKLTKTLLAFSAADVQRVALEPGHVMPWPDTAVKPGWYFLEGQTLKIETDRELFRVYGTAFNTGGEGADEFTLPSPSAPYTDHKWMVKR